MPSKGAKSGTPWLPSPAEEPHWTYVVPGEVSSRVLHQVRPSFNADDVGGHHCQQGGLEAVARADLELPVRCSPSIMRADSDGWVVTWSCPMDTGSSR